MAHIDTVVIMHGDFDDGPGTVPAMEAIHAWFESRTGHPVPDHTQRLGKLNEEFGGLRGPMLDVYGGAFRSIGALEELVEIFLSAPWKNPDEAVMIISYDDKGTFVYRPERPARFDSEKLPELRSE